MLQAPYKVSIHLVIESETSTRRIELIRSLRCTLVEHFILLIMGSCDIFKLTPYNILRVNGDLRRNIRLADFILAISKCSDTLMNKR